MWMHVLTKRVIISVNLHRLERTGYLHQMASRLNGLFIKDYIFDSTQKLFRMDVFHKKDLV